jgi:hypothetical protein
VATKQTTQGTPDGWTDEERAAMKEHAAEIKRSGGKGAAKAAEEAQACLDKIAEMPDTDRVIAERVHALVTETAPDLAVKTWYGMPAYARDASSSRATPPSASRTPPAWMTGACGPRRSP